MAADAWKVYDSFLEKMADGTLDLDNDTFKCALFSSSHTPLQTDDSYSSLTNELATEFGYTVGGVTLTGVTWTDVAGVTTFDFDDPTWDASGGNIVARYAVIYDDTDTGKQLVAMSLLDNTPDDVTAISGEQFVLVISASGAFSIGTNW